MFILDYHGNPYFSLSFSILFDFFSMNTYLHFQNKHEKPFLFKCEQVHRGEELSKDTHRNLLGFFLSIIFLGMDSGCFIL